MIIGLYEHFKVKCVNNNTQFLGMEINKTETQLKISQRKMIEGLFKEFDMEDCHAIATPMETNFQVGNSEELLQNIPYRR